jgi:hypothetical protein
MAGKVEFKFDDNGNLIKDSIKVEGNGQEIREVDDPGPFGSDSHICMWVKVNPTCVYIGGRRY